MKSKNNSSIHQRPSELLQKLIQFNTTNPPGNEAECIQFIGELLKDAGIEITIAAQTPKRPNLIARLAGQGNAAPLLLYGHVDVVTTDKQKWQYPPFEGKLVDGFIWGRGALDMKGGVAMMVSAFLRAKSEGAKLPGDIILTIVSDEEAGGDLGAKYLVDNHPHFFENVQYAIGEFGGFSLDIGNKRFYPIMVAEKHPCWMKAIVRGPGGHGSLPVRDGSMAKLAQILQNLDRKRLPVHITPVARLMFTTIASELGGISGLMIRQLTNPLLTNTILNLLGERGRTFDPLLHNTVSATILHGSDKINVIPSEVTVGLDGRLLPGYRPEDMFTELRKIIGSEVEFEVARYDEGPVEPDMGLFDTLSAILVEDDPGCIPVPLLMSGCTDGRFFSRLGIQTYGFLPMPLPKGFNFAKTIHSVDERVPAESIDFGTNAIYKLMQRY
jgi:acetylornithine deacetylase/succinyl-diaminopimelate desuccinylase-like protein